jgi:hypothetical protein
VKLWRFHDPADPAYRAASRRGAWSTSAGGVCPECTASRQQRIQPLLLEWEPGAEIVGDFVWPGFGSEVVATDRAAAVLRQFPGFEFGPVEVVASAPGSDQRVELRGVAPGLHEVWVTSWVHLDPVRSTARLTKTCGTCGAEYWEVDGVERVVSDYDPATRQLIRGRRPRHRGEGVFIAEPAVGIFRLHELPGWVFCTDEVVQAIREAGLTNVDFLQVGEHDH